MSIESMVRRKFKAKEELTPEERETLRKMRKDRRQRAKENKRREQEEVKRIQMTGAKDLKISLISRDVLQKFYGTGEALLPSVPVHDTGADSR
jgi:uncharacterized membrane protein